MMKTKNTLKIAMLSSVLLLGGCQTIAQNAEMIGTVGGVVVGVAIGASTGDAISGAAAAPYVGGLIGGWLGGVGGKKVGRWVEERDRAYRAGSYQTALYTNRPQAWTNPDTASSGKVTRVSGTWQERVALPTGGQETAVCARFSETYYPAGDYVPAQTRDGCKLRSGFMLL